jgi:hypothetical protein
MDELKDRFRAALAALVEKHGLDLSKRTTLHSRFLAWWLWGDYQKSYRYKRGWLAPPKEPWRIRSRIEALEHLVGLPTSLVHGLLMESFESREVKPDREG